MIKKLLILVLLTGLLNGLTGAEILPGVDAGTYLYADPAKMGAALGGLQLTIPDNTSSGLMAVLYGRKYRKDRKDRDGTTESERERFKPISGRLSPDLKHVAFPPLPIDLYDLVIIDRQTMTVYEGIALNKLGGNPDMPPATAAKYRAEIEKTLFPPPGKIGGWEGFFDRKQISRIELLDTVGAIFLQQMRHARAFAESGDVLKGCIHSLDIVWLERSRDGIAGWKVLNRQQLYRKELTSREFFTHHFRKDLQGIRIGTTLRTRTIRLGTK